MLSSFYENHIYEYSLSQAGVLLIFVYSVSLVVLSVGSSFVRR